MLTNVSTISLAVIARVYGGLTCISSSLAATLHATFPAKASAIFAVTTFSLAMAVVIAAVFAIIALVTLRNESRRALIRHDRARLAAIIDSSDDAIIGKDLEGMITTWNGGAERLYGYKSEEVIGKSIYILIPDDHKEELAHILESINRGERVEHLDTVRCHKDGTRIDVNVTVSPIRDEAGKIVGASAIARDVRDRKRMEASIRELSARILRAQDEERRRIARDLHDSTVQKVALLSMNLSQLEESTDAATSRKLLKTARDLSMQCIQELRSLSYLLHPPMLDELGLPSALKIYAEGFSERSGIKVEVETDDMTERLPIEAEVSLFRVAQEGLSNVMRHSGSARAKVRLRENGEIKLEVSDEGKGFRRPYSDDDLASSKFGVGIRGMRERIRQLGGTLTISSGPQGTTIQARVPRQV